MRENYESISGNSPYNFISQEFVNEARMLSMIRYNTQKNSENKNDNVGRQLVRRH